MDMEQFIGRAERCFSSEGKNTSVLYKCASRIIAAWAVGGQVKILLDDFEQILNSF
jgi:hypothetical protein